jgi:hypothetical protein
MMPRVASWSRVAAHLLREAAWLSIHLHGRWRSHASHLDQANNPVIGTRH